jgi:hypothetical protein
MAALFFSACMPFMAFTNLLRGVDLPSVFFILFFLFLAVCAVNQLAIFLACLPMSRPFKVLLALYGFFQSFWIIVPLVLASIALMRSGVGAMMTGRNFWITVSTVGSIGLALVGLFYFLSVALISPPSANRALPVRIYITIVWVLGGMLSFGWVWQAKHAELMLPWAFLTFALMIFSLLVTISNSDHISPRVRRTIPEKGVRRIVAFIFFNGAAGGLVWVTIISAMTFFVTTEILSLGAAWFPRTIVTGDEFQFSTFYSATMTYIFDYALTALFIQRKFLPKRAPKIAGLLAVLLASFWAIAPSIVLFFLNQLSWKSVEGLQLGNIFNVYSMRDTSQRYYHLIFAGVWLVLMIALNAKWFLRQIKNFKPRPSAPPVLE